MAAIFTPGLTVTAEEIVQKDRLLPLEGEVLVALGDRVEADDIVARTDLPGKIFPVNVANQLGVDPARLGDFLLKDVGDEVVKDELIAATPGILGFFTSEARAVVSGTIQSISKITGQLILQAAPIPVAVDAYIRGRVVEIIEGEGCVVQAPATFVQGIFGLGGETKGELRLAVQSPDQPLKEADLSADMAGQIIIGGAFVTLRALRRAIELGIAGVIIGGFDYDEIKELLGYEVGVAITGGERFGLTLVVTEGFGEIAMAPATFKLLSSCEGQRASINGATQIRAGVIRPEVVVTLEHDLPTERVAAKEPKGIAIGDTVRGIRSPWFGRIGIVSGLPHEPWAVQSEAKVRILEVRFDDGTLARIPRSNVESIKG